jgi:hypothetical protein
MTLIRPGDRAFPVGGIDWQYDDGGRSLAGFRGSAGDCVTRAIAIAAELDYRSVYDGLNAEARLERPRSGSRSSARSGILRDTTRRYLAALGWIWQPTMLIGSGCKVHLRASELPEGRLIVALSRHMTAVVDRVVRDTFDPSREGTRCVYGYWQLSWVFRS